MSKYKFEQITNFENIRCAYYQCLKGNTKYTKEALIFSQNETYNLKILQQELLNKTYKQGGFNSFKVYEPKERLIHAPSFRDKIVQYLLYKSVSEIYNPIFIKDNYASIQGKGMHLCMGQIQKYMKRAKWMWGNEAYIIKIDMQKFFYSIDRNILKRQISKKIKKGDFLDLIFETIDHASIISRKGLPLGNTSSQIFANILLDKLDKYCKNKLSLKFYCRYMDDIFIVVQNKEIAQATLLAIKRYVSNNLNLTVNEKKTKIFPITQGINIVGFKIKTTHKLIRNDSKKRIKRKMKKLEKLYLNQQVSKVKVEQIMNAWLGHARNADSTNFITALINKNTIYSIEDGIFRIKGGQ